MLEEIAVGVVEFIPRVLGWSFLKLVTLGHYQGFRDQDLLLEGGVGLALLGGLGALLYRFV